MNDITRIVIIGGGKAELLFYSLAQLINFSKDMDV